LLVIAAAIAVSTTAGTSATVAARPALAVTSL
jgi:hypothetical protein